MAEDGGINDNDQEGTELICKDTEDADGTAGATAQRKTMNFARHGHGLRLAVADWRIWWLAVAFTAEVTALSFNAFFPTLTATLGFNPTITLILVAPPFFVAAIAAFFNSR